MFKENFELTCMMRHFGCALLHDNISKMRFELKYFKIKDWVTQHPLKKRLDKFFVFCQHRSDK